MNGVPKWAIDNHLPSGDHAACRTIFGGLPPVNAVAYLMSSQYDRV